MDPIDELSAEHQAISLLLESLTHAADAAVREGTDRARLCQLAEFFSVWVDGIHHAKENILFRMMRATQGSKATPMLRKLLAQHGDSNEHAATLLAQAEVLLAEGRGMERVRELAEQYVDEQREHMLFETQHVYPLARQLLTEGQREALRARFRHINELGMPVLDAANRLGEVH